MDAYITLNVIELVIQILYSVISHYLKHLLILCFEFSLEGIVSI